MDFIHAIILGIVEGVSEFLPISSTGHLILTSHLLGLNQNEFTKTFEIAIQLGAILSVVVLYWRRFLIDFEVFKRVLVAFIPTAILGFVLYKFIKKILMGNVLVVVWSFIIGGIILIVFELLYREKETAVAKLDTITYRKAFIIGVCQSIAIVPGVSRSAATIIGGLALGLSRYTIVEFSFLLAVPTMMAATGLDLLKHGHAFSGAQFAVLGVGFVTSFIVALLSIKFLLHFIKNHNFISFGIYRIVIAIVFWFVLR